jgi:hypothetical protein
VTKPQQPEIARSGRSEVDPNAVKTRRGGPTDSSPAVGAVPEDNLPGHHPDHDQDKPEGPPPKPKPRARTAAAKKDKVVDLRPPPAQDDHGADHDRDGGDRDGDSEHFGFDFEPLVGAAGLAFGVTPWTTGLDVKDGGLHIRFGPWTIHTPVDNVLGAEVTGPYSYVKVAGPPRLSLSDRVVTFATTTRRGVCIRFRKPVGLLRHPAATVTVDEPERLVEVLAGS